MELRQLQYFLKVAQKEHVTKAAEELHVAQSAVSRQIHQLEQELGVDLFMQKGRNLQLTPVGQLFCKRVETLLKDLERSVAEVHEFLDPELGEIRIGFPHSLGTHLIPSIVAEFRRHYPNVRFRFKQGTYASLIKDVSSGEVDLAFISPFPENEGNVAGDIVMTEELFAILPQHHPLAGETVIRLEQLRDEKFVLFSQGYSLRPIVWQACIQAGFKPQIAFEGGETDTIRGLVAAGMGVSLLPETALYQTNPMQPAQVRVIEPAVTRTVGIIHRSDGKLPLVARSFRTFLLTYFKDKNNNNPEG
ncbi:LysR family transcriptional regulator [Paenibacillus typhae]|uniref:DNA-binding transcriptional regulator, LysR family n=1 Tax=Paenibacillus typhae TaxID=1174501 RepID=A0A1G8F1A6_9BACL|nr:LysR family transcriptional regulator [Paenibacillus typhae]SDH75928.1 DNA-binding transcriptional regulator, LysR family [Paenibacillus typhae]